MDNLFSTHPNVENRIAQLDELARQMGPRARVEAVTEAAPADGPWASPHASARRRGPWD
jgi:heat shock protein HtpX